MDAEKHNNFYQNLEWCTPKHNQNHAVSMGLIKVKGEENPTAILKNHQVHQICKLMELKIKYADILTEVGLDVTDKNLDILTKIRSKHIWSHISDLYNIPEPEERTIQIIYSDEQLHHICQMIVDEKTNREISIYLDVDMSNIKESDKFYKFIMRIRRRQTYTNITSQFNW